jgi:hypothetical protein
MARTPKLAKQVLEIPDLPEIDIDSLVDQAYSVLKPQADAINDLDHAKEMISEITDGTVRGFANLASGWNIPLDKKNCIAFGKKLAAKLYPNATTSTVQRASELATLTEMRAALPRIIEGVDEMLTAMRAKDPKATLNLRTEVLRAARASRKAIAEARKTKQPVKPLVDILEERRKEKMRKPEALDRIKRLIERLSEEEPFLDTVGDEKMLKPRALAALDELRAIAEGIDEPLSEETDEEQENPDEIEQEGDTPAAPASEPQAPTQPGEAPDTTPAEEPTQQPSQPASGEAVLGMGFDDLVQPGPARKQG